MGTSGRGIDEGWGGGKALQDLAELWLAKSPPGLWRALVLGGGLQRSANHWDASMLFRHYHNSGQPGAVDTALLLCTDNRWRRATGRLIEDIEAAGALTEAELVALAEHFLADTARWELPEEWRREGWISILLTEPGEPDEDEAPPGAPPGDSAPTGPWYISRRIQPPLRRWAAAAILRRDTSRLNAILQRAKTLDARDAAAVVAGILDACDAFDAARAKVVVDLGLTWPAGWVRLVALELVAARDGRAAARQIAAADPSATVRAWAQKPDRPPREPKPPPPSVPQTAPGTISPARRTDGPPQPDPETQPSLFD